MLDYTTKLPRKRVYTQSIGNLPNQSSAKTPSDYLLELSLRTSR
jgi:hypothetical protein